MADKIHDGGPAFPTDNHPMEKLHGGMTLRDWFAGQALAGCMDGRNREQVARTCYELADAMLAAREVKP
jgi:hypothetical protein